MAKSNARKKREKLVKEGKRDFQESRSIYSKTRDGFNFTKSKVGKNKKDILFGKKKKQSSIVTNDDCFYFLLLFKPSF